MDNTFTSRVDKSFEAMLKKFSLPKAFNLIIGLSGGADSSALLDLANRHRRDFGYNLYAIHINHQIRGKEADRDEDFCVKLCEDLDIPLKVRKINVPQIAKNTKSGIEEAARNVRYAEFDLMSKEVSSNGLQTYIATAHNADDQAETVIFNLARGSALNGLCGIKPKRNNIIRPLILCSKDDILGYCDENCIKYIIDSTNSNTEYTRNRIRHNIMPVLKEINPSLLSAISRMTDNISEDEAYLNAAAQEFLTINSDKDGVDLKEFNAAPGPIKRRVLYAYIKSTIGILLEEKHVRGIVELCDNSVKHSKYYFAGDYCAQIEGARLTVKKKASNPVECFRINLSPGNNDVPHGIVGWYSSDEADQIEEFEKNNPCSIRASIRSDQIKGVLCATSRIPGDIININGVNRKLKKLLNEIEPDLDKRSVLPVFRDDLGILWVPGARSRTNSYPKNQEDTDVLLYSYKE